ncbi:hypothetical protein RIF29_33615 [Crotalaria pallida]|uniref:Uncharacterized protein n=1 Tax=Crotalaria pallida TaxID=3830 RepID=A0AAN9E969_CROPI
MSDYESGFYASTNNDSSESIHNEPGLSRVELVESLSYSHKFSDSGGSWFLPVFSGVLMVLRPRWFEERRGPAGGKRSHRGYVGIQFVLEIAFISSSINHSGGGNIDYSFPTNDDNVVSSTFVGTKIKGWPNAFTWLTVNAGLSGF